MTTEELVDALIERLKALKPDQRLRAKDLLYDLGMTLLPLAYKRGSGTKHYRARLIAILDGKEGE